MGFDILSTEIFVYIIIGFLILFLIIGMIIPDKILFFLKEKEQTRSMFIGISMPVFLVIILLGMYLFAISDRPPPRKMSLGDEVPTPLVFIDKSAIVFNDYRDESTGDDLGVIKEDVEYESVNVILPDMKRYLITEMILEDYGSIYEIDELFEINAGRVTLFVESVQGDYDKEIETSLVALNGDVLDYLPPSSIKSLNIKLIKRLNDTSYIEYGESEFVKEE